jgi:hypothetical protein
MISIAGGLGELRQSRHIISIVRVENGKPASF